MLLAFLAFFYYLLRKFLLRFFVGVCTRVQVICFFVHLGKEEPKWAECTEAEKLAWEEAHKPEEPQPLEEVVE